MFDKFRSLLPEVPERIERLVAERTGIEWTDYVKRKKVGEAMMVDTTRSRLGFAGATYGGDGSARMVDITEPHNDDAARWSGWGTALKPAFEPVVVARRPLIGTVAANVLEHGTGALNIDACRISTGDYFGGGSRGSSGFAGGYESGDGQQPGSPLGRWPANVALDATASAILDEQSGDRPGATSNSTGSTASFTTPKSQGTLLGYGDTGGASRFFYTAKASRQDRNVGGLADNTHPTVKPTDLMRWLIRLVTPPGGIILDPFGGSGSTGLAARAENVRCILIERELEYLQIIRDRLAQQNLFATETTTDAT
jgi:site-specific DNA-methyltransferase (adenine-specific)